MCLYGFGDGAPARAFLDFRGMNAPHYPDTQLLIANAWTPGAARRTLPVVNPATGAVIGTVAHAEQADLDRALDSASAGFAAWKRVSVYERSKILRKAADLLRERSETIATLLTLEQGKTLAEAKAEIANSADTIDWFAEEGRRAYGRVIPARAEGVVQLVLKEPVGPVAAFTPWNFPLFQIVRKVSPALAAGCSIIVKAPEETPASPAELIRAFVDAGVPPGVVNLVYGDPAAISSYLIAHPAIRKISFTGSTAVGKQLAALAGAHMKRATMELGGHAPVIVFDDADVALAAKTMAATKFRNAGQVCLSPTRFLVQEGAFAQFVEQFVEHTKMLEVGDGLQPGVTMGALANPRRIAAMESNLDDALTRGGKIRAGGHRIGSKGNFFEPTVVTELPGDARAMNEEPFGPIAIVNPFRSFDDAVKEANRLPYGLAAYAWTRSARTANAIAAAVESGAVSLNHVGPAVPEVPIGGIKDSGYGSEGGSEGIEQYLNTKFVSHGA
jgi:succinate-semialdehyde dehydrogenase / glutarate-semialdehyde dehydrogenase